MSVTRKDVAERARVSEATVSYVVNNGPKRVAPETRQRVLDAIRDLSYTPSDIARSLRMQRTSTIGLLLPDTANPYYGEVARCIENIAYARGYTVILCNSNLDTERERNYAHMLRTKRVEGLVYIPTGVDSKTIEYLKEFRIPTVVLEYEIPGLVCIVSDEFKGGALAAEHLLHLGHTRFGCIARAGDTSSSRKRLEGFLSTLHHAGVVVNSECITEAGPEIADGESAALRLLDCSPRPTAIFTHDDSVALGAMRAVQRRGLNVPHDISIVGFDNITASAYFHPPLTTIASPRQRMGEEAALLLMRLIGEGNNSTSGSVCVLDVQLVERGSTAPANLS